MTHPQSTRNDIHFALAVRSSHTGDNNSRFRKNPLAPLNYSASMHIICRKTLKVKSRTGSVTELKTKSAIDAMVTRPVFFYRISLLQMKPTLAVAGLLAYPFAVGVEGNALMPQYFLSACGMNDESYFLLAWWWRWPVAYRLIVMRTSLKRRRRLALQVSGKRKGRRAR